MTGDLLQSDIDFARRLIAEGQTDGQIIVALGYRRIGPERAQRLVQDLRRGINVQADPLPANLWRPVTIETGDHSHEDAQEELPLPQPHRVEPASPFPWFRVALLGVVAATIAAVFLFNRDHRTEVSATPRELMMEPGVRLRRPGLQVEVGTNQIRISGTALSRENALKLLSELAGPPTRTNRLEDLTMYAFDDNGTVLYSGNKNGKDSLLFYFEPVGGTNGAQHAFIGTLSIRGKAVTLGTDPKTLLSLTELGLKETATNFFSVQTNGLGLSFAYLKTPPTQLSFVQIDLE
jgi:hypothetical protein